MTKEQQIQQLRRKFRKQFCLKHLNMRDQFDFLLSPYVTPQMIEDWWLTEMGLLNNE